MSNYKLIPRELVDDILNECVEAVTYPDGPCMSRDLRNQLKSLPTAQFLDLEGVEKVVMFDKAWVRFSDLTDKLLPPVVGLTHEELAEIVWQTYGSFPENLTHEEMMAYPHDIAANILDRIKGVK
jgi:hypothetical protein